ncbi:MAG: hypothetical protein R2867_05740 [Caldilineaceae bacterium]
MNLVLVSHAQEIALGTKMLAQQMTTGSVQIEAAGGIAEPTSTPEETVFALGTDASRIATAIERCWTADGVLVLVDLGSAVLALNWRSNCYPMRCVKARLISNAPLVEEPSLPH